jgi:hypothetical protein
MHSVTPPTTGYPGHLEILEGNSLVEMRRILAGQQLYSPPSASYVPDGYTPLYFAVSAAAASVLGQSYLDLRLVSLVASLACFAILGPIDAFRVIRPKAQAFPPGKGPAYFCMAPHRAWAILRCYHPDARVLGDLA